MKGWPAWLDCKPFPGNRFPDHWEVFAVVIWNHLLWFLILLLIGVSDKSGWEHRDVVTLEDHSIALKSFPNSDTKLEATENAWFLLGETFLEYG